MIITIVCNKDKFLGNAAWAKIQKREKKEWKNAKQKRDRFGEFLFCEYSFLHGLCIRGNMNECEINDMDVSCYTELTTLKKFNMIQICGWQNMSNYIKN